MLIVDIRHRDKKVEVYQMKDGTFTAFVDEAVTQKNMTGEACIRYLGHMMHEENKSEVETVEEGKV